jgi:hypothetical protein
LDVEAKKELIQPNEFFQKDSPRCILAQSSEYDPATAKILSPAGIVALMDASFPTLYTAWLPLNWWGIRRKKSRDL